MNRKLPVLTEHSLSSVMSSRLAVADAFEREIIKEADTSGKPLSCHSGCDSCCYHPVFLTVTEGILLYRHLVSAGKWSPTFKKSLEAHADMVRELDFPVWLLSMVACPLLDKNS